MNTKNKPVAGYGTSIGFIASTFADAYRSVMTIENSPLKNFDPMVAHMAFQILAFVWSAVFGLMLGSYLAFGISGTLHMLFIAGVVITATVFKTADRANKYNGRSPDGEHY
jgi:hypothetical protein